jgi:hypothetical protein
MKNVKYSKEMIKKWQGIRNSDTGEINGGYLWFYKNKEKTEYIGIPVHNVSTRKEAIQEYYK